MRILLVMALMWGAGCKKTSCTETETSVTGAGARFDFRSCSDDKERAVACELAGTQWTCTCTLAGAKGKTFQLPSNGMVGTKLVTFESAVDHCGW
jgi:hypothetical protein